jgi:hypothetical protein
VSLREIIMEPTPKRPRGRPKAERVRKSVNFRAYPEWSVWLRAASAQTGIDASDIIAEGVMMWARKHRVGLPPER